MKRLFNGIWFILVYSWFDLFSKSNRLRTFISIFQITFLIFVSMFLIIFSGSYKESMIKSKNDPVINRFRIQPDYKKAKPGISADEFKKIKSLQWTSIPGQGKAILCKEEIEKRELKEGKTAYLDIIARHIVTCSIGDQWEICQSSFITTDKDDPIFEKLGIKNIFEKNNQNGIVIKRKTLKELGLKGNPETIFCDNLKEPIKILKIDETNKLPAEGVILEKWYKDYWEKYNYGNEYPIFTSVDIYPEKIEDIPYLADAVEKLGHGYDSKIRLEIDNALKNIGFVKQFTLVLIWTLIALVGANIFLNFQFSLYTKRKEIAFLTAQGFSRLSINSAFMSEGIFITTIAAGIGFAINLALIFFLPGLDFWGHKIELSLKHAQYPYITACLIFCSIILSVCLAIKRTLKSNLAEALKE
jgi:hypothetical protein